MLNTTYTFGNFEVKKNDKQFHSRTIECLKQCSNYNLQITSLRKNYNDYSYFSKDICTNKNNIFLINNISSSRIINKISEDSINNNKDFLISYNYESTFNKENNEIEQAFKEEKISFPIMSEKINTNFVYHSKDEDKYRNRGINLLIRYDLNEKDHIVLDKNILNNLLSFKMNAKIHETHSFLDKDIFFLLDVKKLIKSIVLKIEFLQNNLIKSAENIELIFVPLLEYQNMGVIISWNQDLPRIDIGKMKTNFNAIVKQKFVLKSIFISLNISSIFKRIDLKFNNSKTRKKENDNDLINDNYYDENTSASSSQSPKISYIKFNQNLENCNYNKMAPINPYIFFANNDNPNVKSNSDLSINNNEVYDNYLVYNYENKIYQYFKQTINNNNMKINSIDCNNNRQNNYINCQKYYDNCSILINSNDIFSKTLFNRYQDKTNSTCNLKILKEFLKIKMKKPFTELTLFDFFSSFSKISSMSLKIPFFNTNGNVIKTSLTPYLKEIKIFIENPKFIKKVEKKLKLKKVIPENTNDSAYKSLITDDNNKYMEYEGFEIGFLENNKFLRISYKENKPYYLADSLSDKLDHLLSLFKSLKKLNINKNILINKSYMSIGWHFINSINTLSSSFISYYLFDGNFLGVLSDIKENENNFWLNSVEEFGGKRAKVNYNYLLEENYKDIFEVYNNSK